MVDMHSQEPCFLVHSSNVANGGFTLPCSTYAVRADHIQTPTPHFGAHSLKTVIVCCGASDHSCWSFHSFAMYVCCSSWYQLEDTLIVAFAHKRRQDDCKFMEGYFHKHLDITKCTMWLHRTYEKAMDKTLETTKNPLGRWSANLAFQLVRRTICPVALVSSF